MFCWESFASNAFGLELMDITRDWVSSYVVLGLALNGVFAFSLVLSSASENYTQLGWDHEIDLAIAEYSLVYLQNLLGCFCYVFWVGLGDMSKNLYLCIFGLIVCSIYLGILDLD